MAWRTSLSNFGRSALKSNSYLKCTARFPIISSSSSSNLLINRSDSSFRFLSNSGILFQKEGEKIERPEYFDASKESFNRNKDKKIEGPMSWRTLYVAGVSFTIIGGAFYIVKARKDQQIYEQRNQSIGKADIGGNFELVDHTGKKATDADFHGKWLLLYFGFTHCPDICPDEMEKICEVYDNLVDMKAKDSNIDDVIPLFITVDPERDGVKEIAEYIKEFHPDFVGLTGTKEAITEAARNYRVYFSAGPADEDNDYIVDHTIITYLITPDGQFLDYYGRSKSADMMTEAIKEHMYLYKKLKNPSIMKRFKNFILGIPENKVAITNYG